MLRMPLLALSAAAAFVVGGCASPKVVDVRQAGDDTLTCPQIKEQFLAAQKYEKDARGERGVTGTNVAAVVFFWPALIGTYMNTEDAIKAARERQDILAKLNQQKNCGSLL